MECTHHQHTAAAKVPNLYYDILCQFSYLVEVCQLFFLLMLSSVNQPEKVKVQKKVDSI